MATFKKIDQIVQQTKIKFAEVSSTISKIKNNQISGFDRAKYPNIMDIRPGYKVTDGILKEDIKAIVFTVSNKMSAGQLSPDKTIPKEIDGIPTDVTPATVFDKLRHNNLASVSQQLPGSTIANPNFILDSSSFNITGASTHLRKNPTITYVPPTNVHLDEVTDAMTLICHVSPEEGWNKLQEFLESVSGDLTVGMYDFSAPHIDKALVGVVERDVPFYMCYDGKPPAGVGKSGNKSDDVSEDQIIADVQGVAKAKFEHVKANLSVKDGLWANAYHIKVAVDNQQKFWLSSGNWQSSNQPLITPGTEFSTYLNNYNREWHIIVTNDKLAKMYHDFLMYDLQQSQEKDESAGLFLSNEAIDLPDFEIIQLPSATTNVIKKFPPAVFNFTTEAPLTIQPLLTPDNYMPKITPLIQSAKQTVYFQNQYINISKNATDDYSALLNALLDKCKDITIDCRIILRNEPNARLMKENLVAYGFPQDKIRIQNNCHNKGIIIDGETVVLGSHNWSNYGVEWNRDASLIIYNKDVCAYYQKVFEYDWENRATVKLNESNTSTTDDFAGLIPENAQISSYESLFD